MKNEIGELSNKIDATQKSNNETLLKLETGQQKLIEAIGSLTTNITQLIDKKCQDYYSRTTAEYKEYTSMQILASEKKLLGIINNMGQGQLQGQQHQHNYLQNMQPSVLMHSQNSQQQIYQQQNQQHLQHNYLQQANVAAPLQNISQTHQASRPNVGEPMYNMQSEGFSQLTHS